MHFHPISVFSAAPGKIKLYDDWDCDKPSTINPTVSLPLSVCLVTTGGGGLIIGELPPCSGGTASLIYYEDTACGVSTTNASPSIFAENCMQLAEGTGIYNAKSVMFSCKAAADNPQPTSTSTAVVSAIPVATGSAGDSGAASSTPGPTATSTDHSGSKSTSTSVAGAQTGESAPQSSAGTTRNGSSGTASNGTSTTSPQPSSKSGLGTSNVIALAVGLGIGVPTIAIMLLAWLAPNFRHLLVKWCCCCCGRRKQPNPEMEYRQKADHDPAWGSYNNNYRFG
ncbi:MAG: hypothetical protein Q9191_006038 [Dirinaria sp. TL-2023a]